MKGHKQSDLHKQHKSEYMNAHPEAWQNNIVTTGDTLSEEHKKKIGEANKK